MSTQPRTALDAPTGNGWLLKHLGDGFAVLSCGFDGHLPDGIKHLDSTRLGDPQGLIASRYDLIRGSAYLIRPDQYVAARWRRPTTSQIEASLARAQ